MVTINLVKSNRYQDSVTLMQVAGRLRAQSGVEDAALMMGTEPNKAMLSEAGLLAPEGEAAGPNDLIISMRGESAALDALHNQIDSLLQAEAQPTVDGYEARPRTIAEGLALMRDANLVLISTPGIYAAAEARKALSRDRHVMIFSDNVSLQDEYELKIEASRRGLLLMGPDCGTAIIGGVPLGFANAVRRGPVGVVGASGTGMQELTSLVHRYGGGISHAIGTGSRDLSERIGGEMTLAGLRALIADPLTEVVVVVSKPPHPTSARRILQAAAESPKPVILAFLGMQDLLLPANNKQLRLASTLEEAALLAAQAAGLQPPEASHDQGAVENVADRLTSEQRYVRGLFSGGTFCYEANIVLRESLGEVYSNAPLQPEWRLPHGHASREHTCLDMGADEFTVGRPHPMIDYSARAQRLVAEASDSMVAVLLLDIVLGYGAHPDPARELVEAIRTARSQAAELGAAMPLIVTSICGTDGDPQGLERQRQTLLGEGVIVAPSNAAAARLAAQIAARQGAGLLR